MSTYLDGAIEGLLQGIYQTPKGIYSPTLVIGLGGTGLKVLRTLKKQISHHEHPNIQLIGIDSDNGENHREPLLTALSDRELVILDQNVAVKALASAEAGFPEYKHVLAYLPDMYQSYKGIHLEVRSKVETQRGAGQFRRAGKLLFCSNVSNGAQLDQVFAQARTNLIGLATTLEHTIEGVSVAPGIRIFVVCSPAGGTGAGSLIDCLALIRRHFNGPQDCVTALLLLPGAALDKELTHPVDEIPNTRGNAMATIRELQPFLSGDFSKHTFTFDNATAYEHVSGKALVHDVYLIGDTLQDRTPVSSWREICQAVGYFLYGVVGTGVGASQASGAVNGQIDPSARREAVPRHFNSLGIGVLEYPVDELGSFGIHSALNQFLSHVLDKKAPSQKAMDEANATTASLGIDSLDDLRAQLNFTTGNVSEASYLHGESARKQALKVYDQEFLGMAHAKMTSIDSRLSAYDQELAQSASQIIEQGQLLLDKRARTLATGKHAIAAAHLASVKAKIESLYASFRKDVAARKSKLEGLGGTLKSLEKTIHRLDFYLDRGLRKKYIAEVNRFLEFRLLAKTDAHIAEILTAFQMKVNELIAQQDNVSIALTSLHDAVTDKMESMRTARTSLSFIQSAMPFSDFEKWIQSFKLPIRTDFEATKLQDEQIVREALRDVEAELRRVIRRLDLVEESKKDKKALQRIKSLNVSSQPFMHMIETAPLDSALAPQKYVAANIPDNRDPLLREFPAVGHKTVIAIPTGNQHMVLCLRTIHGFGFAHWRDYESAKRYYRDKEWYFHSFASDVNLPPLEQVSDERADLLQIFGLAMMMDAIRVRGSNYYANIVNIAAVGEDAYCYLTYQKEPSALSQRLVTEGLVQSARRSQLSPLPDHRLGNSIDAAVAAISKSEWVPLVRDTKELFENFVDRCGKSEAAQEISQYVEKILDVELAKVQEGTSRREILDEIAKALIRYAKQLG